MYRVERVGSCRGIEQEHVAATGAYTAAKTGITSRQWAAAIATYKVNMATGCTTYGTCTQAGALDYSAGNGYRWCNGTNWQQINVVP